ncbi:spermidine/putrescine ABC transporter ATP-binding protein [Bacillus sp. 7586-K]|uniref:ABC-2 type transport system ATP-binding protein n=1 Tax=Metabacillus niabensis TaxID=324854 RepID=A0ABT9Z3R9_9BACI|nr:ABC transporter ATP-binding protein [Metabacillus niabensis]MDQ0226609.1 ABC-2 type transport system ATP-binding protein [Metabacillus niabensis]PAD69875.1 spermidine/putrescine ABC transporter ATP-binding protein [Bacillus sp. 7586-K]
MSVQLRNVVKKYGSNYALNTINLTFEKGKIYGLVGPNGSGKSTLLKLITGLVFPTSGIVTVNDETVTRKTSQSVAYLTELDMFYETFTVQETIDFTASQFADFNLERAQRLLKEMKLDGHKKVKSLSKGNRGRLKLVTTLARDTDVILLDEPFSGLDPMVRDAIVKSLLQYVDFDKQIILIATHEINEIESLLDEVIAIYYGSVIGQKNVEQLREEQGLSVLNWFKSAVNKIEVGS